MIESYPSNIPSGVHLTPVISGVNDLGTSDLPFNDIYTKSRLGELHMSGNTVATLFNAAAEFSIMSGASTAGILKNFTHQSDPSLLTYTDATTKDFHVVASVAMDDAANDEIGIAIGVNGLVQDKSINRRKVSTGGDVGAASSSCILELNQNDNVELMVSNFTNTDTVTISYLNLSVHGII